MVEQKQYDPKYIEEKWEKEWIKKGIFSQKEGEKRFSVVIPPPNVTGSLHMGHALNVTLQDIVCRWQRMKGKTVVWVHRKGSFSEGSLEMGTGNKKCGKESLC